MIDLVALKPFMWTAGISFIVGWVMAYGRGKHKGWQEATYENNRVATSQAFASYINNMAKGATYGSGQN